MQYKLLRNEYPKNRRVVISTNIVANIEVNIISGFLGSGKTTIISNLLKNKPDNENWAIIINEFGKVAIDYLLLKDKVGAKDEIIEVAGGCICCSSMDLFENHLKEIKELKPHRIIIEPTGLGGLNTVKDIVKSVEGLNLRPVICLVDIDSVDNPRMKINAIFLSQIKESDITLVSKCDLDESGENAARVIQWIKDDFNFKACYGKVYNGILDQQYLNTATFADNKPKTSTAFSVVGYFDAESKKTEVEFSFSSDKLFNVEKVRHWLQKNTSVSRAKGIIRTQMGWSSFNLVSGRFTIEKCNRHDECVLILFTDNAVEAADLSSEDFIEYCTD